MSKRNKYNSASADSSMVRKLDKLAEYEDFEDNVLPKLKRMIAKNASATDMYKAVESLAAARAITVALTTTDEAKALSAIAEILNRSGGKPTERREVKHEVSNMSDEELDALIKSQKAEDESAPH